MRECSEGLSADFVFVISADGRWPLTRSRKVHILRYGEDTSVKFHSRLTVTTMLTSTTGDDISTALCAGDSSESQVVVYVPEPVS